MDDAYLAFMAFVVIVCAVGFLLAPYDAWRESWREDRQRARRRHPSARVRGGGLR